MKGSWAETGVPCRKMVNAKNAKMSSVLLCLIVNTVLSFARGTAQITVVFLGVIRIPLVFD